MPAKKSSRSGAAKTRERQARQQARQEHRARLKVVALEELKDLPPFNGEYNDELGAALADRVADGMTLDQIASLPNTPPGRVLRRWIMTDGHPFRVLYYEAKKLMVPLYEERAQDAALQPLLGKKRKKKQQFNVAAGKIVNLEDEEEFDNVERARLIVNTYQWSLSHLEPKKHGRNIIPDADNGALRDLLQQFRERNREISDNE